MGQKDLSNCLIFSQNDVAKLEINFDKDFLFIGEYAAKRHKGLAKINTLAKLKSQIQLRAREVGADMAILPLPVEELGLDYDPEQYLYSLYKYKD